MGRKIKMCLVKFIQLLQRGCCKDLDTLPGFIIGGRILHHIKQTDEETTASFKETHVNAYAFDKHLHLYDRLTFMRGRLYVARLVILNNFTRTESRRNLLPPYPTYSIDFY